jgi:hypothetical protein
MRQLMLRTLVLAFGLGLGLVVLAHLGLAQKLGAHPWWAVQVVYIGVGAGFILSVLGGFIPIFTRGIVPLLLVLVVASISLTVYGKTQFAASYAEDALAGRMWYFGWICSVCFGLAFGVRAIVRRL